MQEENKNIIFASVFLVNNTMMVPETYWTIQNQPTELVISALEFKINLIDKVGLYRNFEVFFVPQQVIYDGR